VHRLIALLLLTAAFAPAAVLGALPMVTSIVVVGIACWVLLVSRPSPAHGTVDPVVSPIR
jgi:hypothetical protein